LSGKRSAAIMETARGALVNYGNATRETQQLGHDTAIASLARARAYSGNKEKRIAPKPGVIAEE